MSHTWGLINFIILLPQSLGIFTFLLLVLITTTTAFVSHDYPDYTLSSGEKMQMIIDNAGPKRQEQRLNAEKHYHKTMDLEEAVRHRETLDDSVTSKTWAPAAKDDPMETVESAQLKSQLAHAEDILRNTPTQTKTNEPIKPSDLVFDGMDCSRPLNKQAVIPIEAKDCATPAVATNMVNATYVILQKALFLRQKAYLCNFRYSQVTLYCGVYDHQTLNPRLTHWNLPVEMSPLDCMKAWQDRKYRDFTLQRNGKVSAFEDTIGKTWTTDEGEVKCQGEKGIVKVPSQKDRETKFIQQNRMVQFRQYDMALMEVDIKVDFHTGKVYPSGTGLVLNCDYDDGGCIGDSGVYTWGRKSGTDYCPYYQARISTGADVTSGEGTAFISDHSLIRLVHREPIKVCGNFEIRSTQFPRLFLASERLTKYGPHSFSQQLAPQELAPMLYSNVKTDFSYHYLGTYVTKKFKELMVEECKARKLRESAVFSNSAAEQRIFSEGESAYIGNSFFVTASGEMYWQYQCLPLKATFRYTKDVCYNALPVNLAKPLHERFVKSHIQLPDFAGMINASAFGHSNKDLHAIEFFLEPRTRLLITQASQTPCSDEFPALWKNSRGDWMAINPNISHHVPPREMTIAEGLARFNLDPPKELDFGNGLYTYDMVLDAARIRQIGSQRKDFLNRILNQVSPVSPDQRGYMPGDVFPDLKEIDFSLWGQIQEFVKEYAAWICLAALLVFVSQFITWFLRQVYKAYSLRATGGDGWDIFISLVFPDFFVGRLMNLRRRMENAIAGPPVEGLFQRFKVDSCLMPRAEPPGDDDQRGPLPLEDQSPVRRRHVRQLPEGGGTRDDGEIRTRVFEPRGPSPTTGSPYEAARAMLKSVRRLSWTGQRGHGRSLFPGGDDVGLNGSGQRDGVALQTFHAGREVRPDARTGWGTGAGEVTRPLLSPAEQTPFNAQEGQARPRGEGQGQGGQHQGGNLGLGGLLHLPGESEAGRTVLHRRSQSHVGTHVRFQPLVDGPGQSPTSALEGTRTVQPGPHVRFDLAESHLRNVNEGEQANVQAAVGLLNVPQTIFDGGRTRRPEQQGPQDQTSHTERGQPDESGGVRNQTRNDAAGNPSAPEYETEEDEEPLYANPMGHTKG